MVDQDILLAKVAAIRRCLERIRTVTGGDPESLVDLDRQDVFVLNLQRAVQAAIDLAVHIVSDESWGIPATLKEAFTLMAAHGVVSRDLGGHLEAMVGFRNLAVHDYQAIDPRVLQRILTERLGDLDTFCDAALAFAGRPPGAG